LKILENKPDRFVPQRRAPIFIETRQILSEHGYRPLVGASNPAHKPSSVVFPLPDGPTIASESPSFKTNETSFNTVNSPSPLR
jgi:hypothetical protein